MSENALNSLSPLDGRYHKQLDALRPIFSEYGLIYYRLVVEVRWLITLADEPQLAEIPALSSEQRSFLEDLITNFSIKDANLVKTIEKRTNHDVKAVEYFIRKRLESRQDLNPLLSFIHFACTSEDINNLAYAMMLRAGRDQVLLPLAQNIINMIAEMGESYRDQPMLARTHGQPASPTTLGKELINFAYRLQRQFKAFSQNEILGKFNGAVGNFNAHRAAYPDIDWHKLNQAFVTELGLVWNPYTTQIEPHDYIAEIMQTLMRFNNILIDFNRDIWSYISLNYFVQQQIEHEVGSSTMPHKVNPIDFENAEGNLGLANALANHLANKLPISRWQRDLTDSTVMRNLGQVFGFSYLAYQSMQKGLAKLAANPARLREDLQAHWEVLAEAIQTVMRRYGIIDAYEQLKAFTRGKNITQELLQEFIDKTTLSEDAKTRLKQLTPENYIGDAVQLTKNYPI